MAAYTIGGTLTHALGGEWANHKYIRKIPIGGGKFQYVYNEPGNSRVVRRPANEVNTIRNRYSSGVSSDRRAANNVGRTTKSSYAIEKQYGMPNTTRIGQRTPQSKEQRALSDARRSVNAAYTRTTRAARQTARQVARSVISELKTQAASAKDWGKKQMDWAGEQVQKGVAAARNFISQVLQKLGSATTAAKWAQRKAVRARDAVYNTFRPKYNKIADHVIEVDMTGLRGNRAYGKSVVGTNFLGDKVFKPRKDTRAGRGGNRVRSRGYSTRD